MDDTNAVVKKVFEDMMKGKTPEERLVMGCSMFMTAKAIVESSIRACRPALSSGEVRKKIFLRFYGNDFKAALQKRIIKELLCVS